MHAQNTLMNRRITWTKIDHQRVDSFSVVLWVLSFIDTWHTTALADNGRHNEW